MLCYYCPNRGYSTKEARSWRRSISPKDDELFLQSVKPLLQNNFILFVRATRVTLCIGMERNETKKKNIFARISLTTEIHFYYFNS